MIKTDKLIYEYQRTDAEGNAEGTTRALDSISIHVKPGKFVAIVGHNGSGKSTFARLINGLLFPTDGEILVDGMDTRKEELLLDIRRTAGMVFQNPDNQIIGQVVEEDVAFGPENMGVPTPEIRERVESALKTIGMYDHRKDSPNRLSGGQKQRVSIAGVIAMRPKCLIMDEPTAMLDPRGRKEVIRAVHKLNQEEGITVLLITHHMDEVVGADYVFVMDGGHAVMEGTPREIFAQVPKLKELKLTAPQATLLAEELTKAGIQLFDGRDRKNSNQIFEDQQNQLKESSAADRQTHSKDLSTKDDQNQLKEESSETRNCTHSTKKNDDLHHVSDDTSTNAILTNEELVEALCRLV